MHKRRPTKGKAKKGHGLKFRYVVRQVTASGELKELTDAEFERLESTCPGIARRWLTNAGEGTWQEQCGVLINMLHKSKYAKPFLEPVDPVKLLIPNYFNVIKSPMDLGTVRTRLLGGFYLELNEFADAVLLTFSNAMTFNPPGSDVYHCAAKLQGTFESKLAAMRLRLGEGAVPAAPPAEAAAAAAGAPAASGSGEAASGELPQAAADWDAAGGDSYGDLKPVLSDDDDDDDEGGGAPEGAPLEAVRAASAPARLSIPSAPHFEDMVAGGQPAGEADGAGERPTEGGKAPPSEGGEHPSEGGKAPMSSDSAADGGDDDDDEGVSESDLFDDDDDDDDESAAGASMSEMDDDDGESEMDHGETSELGDSDVAGLGSSDGVGPSDEGEGAYDDADGGADFDGSNADDD